MNKKVIGIIVAIVVIIAIVVLCICLGNKNKEETTSNPVVVINESGEKEETPSKVLETDPYVSNVPNEILDAYLKKVDEIEKKHKDDMAARMEEDSDLDLTSLSMLKYDLVFFDEDDIPELVVTNTGYNTRLYTYDNGKVVYTMKDDTEPDEELGWAYGAGGNHGYEFIPRGNTLGNYNADFAGLMLYTAFYKLDEAHNLVNKFDGVLCECHFDDKNDNGTVDDDEMESYTDDVTAYYVNEKKITADEAKNYIVDSGDFEPLEATKVVEEFRNKLLNLVNEK